MTNNCIYINSISILGLYDHCKYKHNFITHLIKLLLFGKTDAHNYFEELLM